MRYPEIWRQRIAVGEATIDQAYKWLCGYNMDPIMAWDALQPGAIARERRTALHVVANARAYLASYVRLCWRFLKIHGARGG